MLVYWLIFLLPAILSLTSFSDGQEGRLSLIWVMFLIVISMIIGFRYQVGGDWLNYMSHLYIAKNKDISSIFQKTEIGFSFLTWIGANFFGGIYLPNFLGALLFSYGLIKFCLQFSRPWLAITVAVPYMIIVMSMGYTRQSIALGAVMLGFCALEKNKIKSFILYIGLGYLFHKTCLLLLPLIFLFKKQSLKGENFLFMVLMAPVIYELYNIVVINYTHNYMESGLNSSGAAIRLYLNLLPGLIYLLFKNKFSLLTVNQHKLCNILSILSALLVLLFYASPSSTAVDRMALYLQPLQLIVWSNFPDAFAVKNLKKMLWILLVILFYALVEFVWLFYGTYSSTWLPYRFYWLEVVTGRIWMFNPITQYI